MRIHLTLPAAALALTLLSPLGAEASAAPLAADGDTGKGSSRSTPDGGIGVRLLEAPSSRLDDPRARIYIVDHVNPNTTFSRRFEVVSTSSQPLHVRLYPAAAAIDKGTFTFAPGRTPSDLTTWITLSRTTVHLPPHGRATVAAKVSVPPNAVRGERYAVIWAEVASPPPGPEGNVAIVHRVGIRTYLDVGPGGEPPSDFTIGAIETGRTGNDRPSVTATVHNTGERALDLTGRLDLLDGPSRLRAGPFRVTRAATLAPGQRGQVTAILSGDQLPDGPWQYRITLHSGRITRTKTGSLTLEPGSRAFASANHLRDPMLIAGALAGVAGIAILVRNLRRRRVTPLPE